MENSLLSIIEPYRVILLDAFGVFWGGNAIGLYPGVLDTFAQLKACGKIVGIISNATFLAESEKNRYASFGLQEFKHYDFLITSGQMLHDKLNNGEKPFPFHKNKKNKYWVFGDSHQFIFKPPLFEETYDLHEADFIYLDIPRVNGNDQKNISAFAEKVKSCIAFNLPMICANPDKFVYEQDPVHPVIRQGAIAELYEKYGGHVYYFGKPHKLIFATVFSYLQEKYAVRDKADIILIGDNPETDIRGGNMFGITTVLISKTGIAATKINRLGQKRFLEILPEDDRPAKVIFAFS